MRTDADRKRDAQYYRDKKKNEKLIDRTGKLLKQLDALEEARYICRHRTRDNVGYPVCSLVGVLCFCPGMDCTANK